MTTPTKTTTTADARPRKPSGACKLHNGNHPYVTCPNCEHQYCPFYWRLCPQCNPDVEPTADAGQNRESEGFHEMADVSLSAKPADVHAADGHTPETWRITGQAQTEHLAGYCTLSHAIAYNGGQFEIRQRVADTLEGYRRGKERSEFIAAAPETAAERDRLREQIREHQAEYDRLSAIIEKDTMRVIALEQQVKTLLDFLRELSDARGVVTLHEQSNFLDEMTIKARAILEADAAVESEGQ